MATGNQLIASYATLTNQLGDAFNSVIPVINISSISTLGTLTNYGDLIILNPGGSAVNTATQPTLSNTASNANGIIFDGINATLFQNKILAQSGLRVESIGASNFTEITDGNIVCETVYSQASVLSGIIFATDYLQASNHVASDTFKNSPGDTWYKWTNGSNTSELTATYGYFNNLSTSTITAVESIKDVAGNSVFTYDFSNATNILEATTGNFTKLSAQSLTQIESIKDGGGNSWFSYDSNTFTNEITIQQLNCSNIVPAPLYSAPLIPSAFLSENSTINLFVSTPTVLGSTTMTTTSFSYMMAQANIQIDHNGSGKHTLQSYLEITDASGLTSIATSLPMTISLDAKLSPTIPTTQNLTLNLRTPSSINPDTYQIIAWAIPGVDQTDIYCPRLDLIGYGSLG